MPRAVTKTTVSGMPRAVTKTMVSGMPCVVTKSTDSGMPRAVTKTMVSGLLSDGTKTTVSGMLSVGTKTMVSGMLRVGTKTTGLWNAPCRNYNFGPWNDIPSTLQGKGILMRNTVRDGFSQLSTLEFLCYKRKKDIQVRLRRQIDRQIEWYTDKKESGKGTGTEECGKDKKGSECTHIKHSSLYDIYCFMYLVGV